MNFIMTMRFMRSFFEVSSVAATMLPSGWRPLLYPWMCSLAGLNFTEAERAFFCTIFSIILLEVTFFAVSGAGPL